MTDEEEVEGEEEEEEEKPEAAGGPTNPSEIHKNMTQHAAFVAEKLNALFATTVKIQGDIADLENKLRAEFDEKVRVHHELAMTRIVALEELCTVYGLRLDDQKRTQEQQAMQLDDLQNQVGILFFRFH
ncbi:uncharacterized protein [Physcomitrium patens]|uniref:Uncharacterized protein n=1 Tax=Physcomitrium patens TaxID=3218 RepID=A9TTB6_PHYPA|nr:uncharacterized protein LOC112294452 [Physcomitrium patens]PNR36156.1 hypothetical protein PHYPA_022007 [Physcomitrium patens]|eukprot:XP_024400644.1 uncharacterized protein LOC112294452 [Physcomitrella patens]